VPNTSANRFQFIAHALAADGPFRPSVTRDGFGVPISVGTSYLVRYARESTEKFASRNEMAFYASPLSQACDRFIGYLSTKAPQRKTPHQLFTQMADDIDGRGNSIDVFWQQFAIDAKARGSMLLLVDMPSVLPQTQADQVAMRAAPYWSAIAPETVSDYAIGDDGKFDFVEFDGTWARTESGEKKPCTWRFERLQWRAYDRERRVLGEGFIPLGECPVLIFTEGGQFPHFGSFSAIADLSRRLFNLDSELDEILRSQTFSLLTMQVPDSATEGAKIAAAQTAGETISTSNLLMHTGNSPAFIAPPDGPARVYLDRIDKMRDQINEIGLNVATINAQESGIAMQMRFAQINGALSRFSGRMEDLERRAWDLSRRWLGMTAEVEVAWPRDFNLSDLATEMQVLADMQASNMPADVIAEQQKRIVMLQFASLPAERIEMINSAIDERLNEVPTP
jgi:hypothetical protein